MAWKATERRLARLLGGKRIPINGRRGPDIAHEVLSVEVKERASVPAWLETALEQAASGKGIPLVVLHKKGWRSENDLVLMRLDSLLKLLDLIDGNEG